MVLATWQLSSQAQTFHNPPSLFNPRPYAFSHAALAPPGGQLLFIAGQSGAGAGHVYSPDFRVQVRNSLAHLKLVLDEFDLKAEHILKITLLIVDHDAEKLKIWSEEAHQFWDPEKFPASTLIPVPRLASDGMLFEIEAIAYKSTQKPK